MTLVKCAKLEKHFALKAVAKAHIIETGQEEFLLNEKKVGFCGSRPINFRAVRSPPPCPPPPSFTVREPGHAGP